MKTAEERADDYIDACKLYGLTGFKKIHRDALAKVMDAYESEARKKQDRDTRHACSENAFTTDTYNDGEVLISRIHSAIMNTKAV